MRLSCRMCFVFIRPSTKRSYLVLFPSPPFLRCANTKWRACLSSFSTSELRGPRSAVTRAPSPVAAELLLERRCSLLWEGKSGWLRFCVLQSGAHRTSCCPSLAVSMRKVWPSHFSLSLSYLTSSIWTRYSTVTSFFCYPYWAYQTVKTD